MARWIIQRPQEHCHPAEIRAAEQLRELDDRLLTPQTDASIRIVIGSLASLAGGGAGEVKSPAEVIN